MTGEFEAIGQRRFFEQVILDTGIEHNWISMDKVEYWGLKYRKDDVLDERIYDFNNNLIECGGSVVIHWCPEDGPKEEVILYIAKGEPPFDVLFGYLFLLRTGIVVIPEQVRKSGLVGVRDDKRKPGSMWNDSIFQEGEMLTVFPTEGKAIDGNDQAKKDDRKVEEEYKKWFMKRKNEGWTWDSKEREFYQIQKDQMGKEKRVVAPDMDRWRTERRRPGQQ